MSFVPEIIVGISYYPCGVVLGYTMYTFLMPNPSQMLVWPQVLIIIGALVSGATLTVTRLVTKRVMFLHFYLMALGTLLMFIGGMVLVISRDYVAAAILGGFGYGIHYVAGLAYIHIRSNSNHRLQRIALCHVCLMIGIVSSIHYYGTVIGYPFVFGLFLMYSCGTVLVGILINELVHGLKVYNYKIILDDRLRAGDEKRDNFSSILVPENNTKSPENAKQLGLAFMMLVTKVLNGFLYNNIFLLLTLATQIILLWLNLFYIPHYVMLGGLVVGIVISLSVKIRFLFGGAVIFSAMFLFMAGIFMEVYEYGVAAIFFWIFYLLLGSVAFIPDAGLMEMSSLKVYELLLCSGVILEQIPIMVTIHVVNSGTLNNAVMWTNIGVYIGLAAILGGLVMRFYPDTHQKSILEIQQLVLYDIGGRGGAIIANPVLETRPDPNIQPPIQMQTYAMPVPMMQPQAHYPYPTHPLQYPQQPQPGFIPVTGPFYNQGNNPVAVGATMKHPGELPMSPPQYADGQTSEHVNPSAPGLSPNTGVAMDQNQMWASTKSAIINTKNNPEL